MSQSKEKFKVVGSSSKLKSAIGKLPDTGFEFTALRGHEKGKAGKDPGPESVGLFVDSATGSDYSKEKSKIASGQFFKGTLLRSTKDPKGRLVLETNNSARPLLELARECLKEAGVKMKVVVRRPGEAEPDSADEDGGSATTAAVPGVVARQPVAPARPTQPLPPAKPPQNVAPPQKTEPPKPVVKPPPLPPAYAQVQVAWRKTREKVHGELQKLEKAILDVYAGDDDLPEVTTAVRKLDAVLQRYDDALIQRIDELNSTADPQERLRLKGAIEKLVADYQKLVDSDPLVARLDSNPFVKVSVEGPLRNALELVASRVASV